MKKATFALLAMTVTMFAGHAQAVRTVSPASNANYTASLQAADGPDGPDDPGGPDDPNGPFDPDGPNGPDGGPDGPDGQGGPGL